MLIIDLEIFLRIIIEIFRLEKKMVGHRVVNIYEITDISFINDLRHHNPNDSSNYLIVEEETTNY